MDIESAIEILVKFNVIGQNQIVEARKALESTRDAVAGVADSEKKGSEAAEIFHKNHRAIHLLLHELGSSIAPQAGQALSAMMFGPIGAGIAAIAIFRAISEHLNEIKKKAMEVADAEAKLNTDIWERRKTAITEAATAMDNVATAMSKMEDASKRELDNQKAIAKLLEDQYQTWIKILKAKEAAETAAANDDPAKKAEIAKRFEATRTAASLEEEKQDIARKQAELAKAKGELEQVTPAREEAAKTYGAAVTNDDAIKRAARLKEANDKQAQLDKDFQEHLRTNWKGTYEELQHLIENLTKDVADEREKVKHGKGSQNLLNEGEEALHKLTGIYEYIKPSHDAAEENRKLIANLGELDKAHADAVKRDKDEMDALTKKVKDLTGQISALETEIETQAKLHLEHTRAAHDIATISETPESVQSTVTAAVQAIIDAKKGKFTDADKNAINDLNELLNLVGLNSDAVIKALGASTDTIKTQGDEIKAIDTKLKQMQEEARQRMSANVHNGQ